MSSTSSNTFIGNLTGTATNATTATNTTNIATTLNNTTGTDVYPTFVTAAASSNQPANLSANLRYVPSTNNLFASTFTGSLTGTASNATNAANIATTLDNTTGTDAYPTFVLTSANGNKATTVSSNLKYNPNTNTLIATTFSGTASNATTASTATNVATTLNDSGSTAVYPIFVTSPSTSSSQAIGVDSGLSFIPTTNALTASAMKTSSLDTATGTGTLTIGVSGNTTELKSGNLNIQNDATTAGTVNIKCGATSTGDVNIKNGTSAGGSVNIANSTGTVTTNIGAGTGTGTVTIGNTANQTDIKSGTVTISRNTAGTGTVARYIEMLTTTTYNLIRFHTSGLGSVSDSRITTYGGSATDDQGTIEFVANNLQVNSSLTMGTAKSITLQPTSGYVKPTQFTMLGGTNDDNAFSSSIGTTPAAGTYVMKSIQVPNNGMYLFTFLIQTTYTGTFTYFYSNVASTTTLQTAGAVIGTPNSLLLGVNFGQQPLGNVGSLFMNTGGSFVAQLTSTLYYNLILYISGGGTLGTPNGNFQITRIG